MKQLDVKAGLPAFLPFTLQRYALSPTPLAAITISDK